MTFESHFLCWMFIFHPKKRHRVVLLMFAGDLFWNIGRSARPAGYKPPLPDSRRLVNDGLNESFLLMSGTFQTGLRVILADFWEQNSQQQTTQTCKECNALTSWSLHYLAFGYKNMIEYSKCPGFILRKISFRRNLQNPSVGMWRVNLARSILQSFS